jgi:hypothetical protein
MTAAADDAYAEFARVRAAVAAARYPERIDYAIAVTGTEGSQARTDTFRARYYAATGELRVQTITAQEAADPPHPHGFDYTLNITLYGVGIHTKNLAPSKANEDLLGVPFLTPTYSFGISRAPLQIESPAPSPEASDQSAAPALKTIAVVVSPQRDYDISFAATEPVGGVPAEHLVLRPLRDPNRFRLRDVWVDPATKLPRAAVIARNFTVAPEDTVPWKIDFGQRDGGLYITQETALAPLHEQHSRIVWNATVAFDYAPAGGEVPAIPLDPGPFRSLLEP